MPQPSPQACTSKALATMWWLTCQPPNLGLRRSLTRAEQSGSPPQASRISASVCHCSSFMNRNTRPARGIQAFKIAGAVVSLRPCRP